MDENKALRQLKSSPWSFFPNDDDSASLWFHVDGEPVVKIDLDKNNRTKLAFMLLEPLNYKPNLQGVSVRLCQTE